MYKNDNTHGFCFPVIPLSYRLISFSVTFGNNLMTLGSIIDRAGWSAMYKNDNSLLFVFQLFPLLYFFCFNL